MVCPRLAISFSYLPDFPHKAQVYPEHRFSERYSSLSNKPRYMFNNTISQLNAEQWSRTYTLWLPWHQLIHCYLDNCKFLYTYQLACTLTTELMLPEIFLIFTKSPKKFLPCFAVQRALTSEFLQIACMWS